MANKKPGASPGSLVYVGEQPAAASRVRLLEYNKATCSETTIDTVAGAVPAADKSTVSWINLDGLADVALLEQLGQQTGVHALVLEDILNTEQRPKLEEHEGHLFIVVRMLQLAPDSREVTGEQVSLLLGPNYLLSFQERTGDVFDPVRERLRSGRPRIRAAGADYLLYALLDAIVDQYFVILEQLGERIEALEEGLMHDPGSVAMADIHYLRRELLVLRRSVWPLREVVASLERSESKLIRKSTHLYLRDVYDHTVQVLDATENYRETVAGLFELYLSSISNKTNEVMKVLTMVATIFIPLSFLAGLYGMNFEVMPELHVPWGYPVLLGVMLTLAGSLVFYFKRKNWL
ncbi:magnesium/cobalt transporter CorA [bacterium]|nr:magnesium/cobalt transporter CorA [bacterium]